MGFGVYGKRKSTVLLFLAAILGLVAANPLSLGFNAYGQPSGVPQFTSASGQTMYVLTGEDVTLSLAASDSNTNDVVTITSSQIPADSTFSSTPGNPASASFEWKDVGPAGGYSLIFSASDQQGTESTLALLLVVEDSIQTPIVSLDRSEYVVGDEVKVTVADRRANVDFTKSDIISVKVSSDTDLVGFNINLTESPSVPGNFTGSFQLTSGVSAGKLSASVGDKISIKYQRAGDGMMATANATIESTTIRLDRTIYATNGVAEITVIDSSANVNTGIPDQITVLVKSPQDDLSLNLIETGANTGVFAGTLNLADNASDSSKLFVKLGDTIQASRNGKSDESRIYHPVTVAFASSTYLHRELAELWIIDVDKNHDSSKVETITAIIRSNVDNVGIPIQLRENGTDTGVFVNPAYITFVNSGSSNQNNVAIRVNVDNNTNSTVTATYGGISNQTTIMFGGGEGNGVGGAGANEAPQTEGVAIGSITVLNCNAYGYDDDHDGICNGWETIDGSSPLMIPYPQGATPFFTIADSCNPCPITGKKDVYVEIDWVSGYKPYRDAFGTYVALESAKQEFGSNIRLHYTVSDDVTSMLAADRLLPVWSKTSGPPFGYDQIKEKWFGTSSDRTLYPNANAPNGINVNYTNAKRQVYHYALFAYKQSGNQGSSGLAEILGNDMIISLGSFAESGLNNTTVSIEKGTFLHELGHNLGLHHGGGFLPHSISSTTFPTWIQGYDINCKPNYPSVMSYVRQIPPAGMNGANIGDSTHFSKVALNDLDVTNPNGLNEGAGIVSRLSNWTPKTTYGFVDPADNVRKIMVIPMDPVGTTDGTDVDWNYDRSITSGVNEPGIVNLNIIGCGSSNSNLASSTNNGILKGYNDLTGFVYDFRVHNPSIFVNGVHEKASERPMELDFDTWTEINAKIVPEFPLAAVILALTMATAIGMTLALRNGKLGSFFGRP